MSKNQERETRRQSRELSRLIAESLSLFPNPYQAQARANWVCEQWNAAHPDSFAAIIREANGRLTIAAYDKPTNKRPSAKDRARKQELTLLEAQAKQLFTSELEGANWMKREWLKRHPEEDADVVKVSTGRYKLMIAPKNVRLDRQSGQRRESFDPSEQHYVPPTRLERRAAASLARKHGLEDVEVQNSNRGPLHRRWPNNRAGSSLQAPELQQKCRQGTGRLPASP